MRSAFMYSTIFPNIEPFLETVLQVAGWLWTPFLYFHSFNVDMACITETTLQLRLLEKDEHFTAGGDLFFAIRGAVHPLTATRIPNAIMEMLAMETHQFLAARLQQADVQIHLKTCLHSDSKVSTQQEYLRIQPWDSKTKFEQRLTELQTVVSENVALVGTKRKHCDL